MVVGGKMQTSPWLRQQPQYTKCLPLPLKEKEGSALEALIYISFWSRCEYEIKVF